MLLNEVTMQRLTPESSPPECSDSGTPETSSHWTPEEEPSEAAVPAAGHTHTHTHTHTRCEAALRSADTGGHVTRCRCSSPWWLSPAASSPPSRCWSADRTGRAAASSHDEPSCKHKHEHASTHTSPSNRDIRPTSCRRVCSVFTSSTPRSWRWRDDTSWRTPPWTESELYWREGPTSACLTHTHTHTRAHTHTSDFTDVPPSAGREQKLQQQWNI